MTRIYKYALTAVLSALVVVPAFAQDNFPDVPDNHWAYEALARMKREGILVGYPDGLFRGGRPATRYEMAVAIHAAFTHLKNLIDGLNGQIEDIKRQMAGGGDMQGLQNLKSALEALQADVNRMKEQDIADLRRMAQTFERELASLGVDVQQMKRDLGSLADRVTNLENRLPVDISGGLDFWLGSGMGDDDDTFGLTVDARPTGVGDGSYDDGEPVGGMRDLTIMHEASLTLTGARKTGPRFKVTMVFGNMLHDEEAEFDEFDGGSGFGNQSQGAAGSGFSEASSSFYIQNASIGLDSSFLGMAFNADIGRMGYKVSPYTFQRQDVTPYFANDRWDNAEWSMDGANLGFNFGNAKLNVFGGRTAGDDDENGTGRASNGTQIQPLTAGGMGTSTFGGPWSGALEIDQMLGFHLSLPVLNNGSLNLAYLWLDANDTQGSDLDPGIGIAPANRVNVLGGDLKFNFGNFMVGAGYSESTISSNGEHELDDDNSAWFAQVGLDSNRWGATLGFRSIEENFGAPGDWGRIGTWWNPTDIEGFYADAHFDLTDMFRLKAKGEWYNGLDSTAGSVHEDDDITRFVIGLEYKMATSWDMMIGYERVDVDSVAGSILSDEHEQTWWNLGFGWAISDNAKWSLMYQASKEEFFGSDSAKGGLLTSQLSVKF